MRQAISPTSEGDKLVLESIGPFINCAVPLVLIVVGFIVGRFVERSHLARLAKQEAVLMTLPVTNLKHPPAGMKGKRATLVSGAVVIGSDYFKTFVAGLRKLIGGEVRSYERMMERARREAICRMLAEAHRYQAMAVINVRIATSNIGGIRRNPTPMVEVLAYGTAVLPGLADPHP